MGMFDNIDTGGPVPCPECGKNVSGFQSKDGPCELKTLHWTQVNRFYALCDKCKAWIEYVREAPDPTNTPRFDGYDLTVSTWEERHGKTSLTEESGQT